MRVEGESNHHCRTLLSRVRNYSMGYFEQGEQCAVTHLCTKASSKQLLQSSKIFSHSLSGLKKIKLMFFSGPSFFSSSIFYLEKERDITCVSAREMERPCVFFLNNFLLVLFVPKFSRFFPPSLVSFLCLIL